MDDNAIMEEAYTLVWDSGNAIVQNEEEVISNVESDSAILQEQPVEEFDGMCEEVVIEQEGEQPDADDLVDTEEMVVETSEADGSNIVYVTEDEMMVMQQAHEIPYDENHFVLTQEEIIAENWPENCSEIIVGSEENIEDQPENEEIEIPLIPTDQDHYSNIRPYPCDFCSRRFSKKANLQNHMISHQQDRPHCCNLCGISYIRKCDLMNHLKTHAYSPENNDEEIGDASGEYDFEHLPHKRAKSIVSRRKNKLKTRDDDEDDSIANNFAIASGSKYNYTEEDVRLMEGVECDSKTEFVNYLPAETETGEPKFPITDPRKPFVCQICGVAFTREKALASHIRMHGGDSPFECRNCREVYYDLALLKEHMREQHGSTQEFDEDEEEEYSAEEETKFGQFFCLSCGMVFHRHDNLKRHQKTHIKEEMTKDGGFGHTCNVCGESFPEALELLAHAEVHARGWEHRCMICGEVFIDETMVGHHVATKHKNLPPNTCMQCGRTCKDKRTHLKHMAEHSREKAFGCNKCDKTFHNKARLKRHMLSHRNKVVTCEECGESFPDGRTLMNHRHSHSSLSGRHFPCKECGKTFGSRSSQQIHIRIHTGERPYECRFCWKAFADGGTLRKHERIHTGEKPYACIVCPRAFNQRVVLREHIRSHHSAPDVNLNHTVTPYSCTVCSDMFATSQDLIVHLIHHCDLLTAEKRQPQVGPRKYKRRRRLKPHEIELMSAQHEDNEVSDSDNDYKRKIPKKQKKTPPKQNTEESYYDAYNNFTSPIESVNIIANSSSASKSNKLKRKSKADTSPVVPSRPKMIHTQKTRVPVDNIDGSKGRHRMKTLVTHTQPTELRSATGERIRPRTKNVSYHVFQGEKLPLATFPDDDATEAVNNLIASEENLQNHHSDYDNYANTSIIHSQNGVIEENPPEIASEQTVESVIEEEAIPDMMIKVSAKEHKKGSYSLRPGRTIIGPGDKVVRLVKGGMIVSKNKIKKEKVEVDEEEVNPFLESDNMSTTITSNENNEELHLQHEFHEVVNVKQEYHLDPLQELAEISMQHAQNNMKCDMCSDIFSCREELLEHVRIHI